VATALVTPLVRTFGPLTLLPDAVEAYIRPVAGLSNFVFFPWAGFLFAGAVVGLVLDAARDPERERRANILFGLGGLAVAGLAYRASFLSSPYPESRFWTTSPSFFFLRAGLITAAVAAAYLWESRPRGAEKWSPLRQLGRTSLFIYWIHVELVYGLISLDLHKSLSFSQALIALVCFSFFMLLCSLAKDRFVRWWKGTPVSVSTEWRRMTS
jgi:fucose 4-O-acetylase-like acetyltransferase